MSSLVFLIIHNQVVVLDGGWEGEREGRQTGLYAPFMYNIEQLEGVEVGVALGSSHSSPDHHRLVHPYTPNLIHHYLMVTLATTLCHTASSPQPRRRSG